MSEENGGSSRRGDGRFRTGQSGNLTGRPKKETLQQSESDFRIIASRTISTNRSGDAAEISLTEALQLKMFEEALSGDKTAIREVLSWIKKREQYFAKRRPKPKPAPVRMRWELKDSFNAYEAMKILGIIGVFEDECFKSDGPPRHVIEPWAAQAALSRRRGGSKLTERDITAIKCCTRDYEQLHWPRGTKT